MYNLDYKLPFVLSVYNDAIDQLCKVEVYVPILPKEFFILDVAVRGKALLIKV